MDEIQLKENLEKLKDRFRNADKTNTKERYPGLFIKSGTNVPPVAFKVLAYKHFNADTEARDGFADCFSVYA
jgi:hypothetical protein